MSLLRSSLIVGVIATIIVGVFRVDAIAPLGIPVWILYLVPVILTFWLRHRMVPLLVAAVCSGLVLVAFSLSPTGIPAEMALLNRMFGVMGLGITAALVLKIKDANLAVQVELAERIRMEESVRQSEARLRAILDAALDAVIGADADGRINYWNPSAETLFLWRSDEVIGRRLTETIIPAADCEAHDQGLRRFRSTGEGPILNQRVEMTALRRNGQEFPIELVVVADRTGDVPQFHAFIEDISERKRKEEALRVGEERSRAIAEASPTAMVICRETDGQILWANKQFCRLVNLRHDEVTDHTVLEFSRPPVDRQVLLSLLGPHKVLHDQEIELQKAGGSSFWALMSIHRLQFGGVPALFFGLHDLTEHKHAQEQLKELTGALERRVEERTHALRTANEKLQEHDRLKSAFVSIVSHELRTPMTAIKGYVENLLERIAGPLTEKQTYCLTRVLHNVDRLTRMLNDLLDISRIEAGRVELNLAHVSIAELLSEVVESFQPIARKKLITLQAYAERSLPLIHADRDKLHQVLINLLQNAIKFTGNGGEIEVHARREEDVMRICVSDTGVGIHPDDVKRIFDSFYRGRVIGGEAPGAGLGLSITKKLIELHGGRIWVESSLSEGSRFYFTLPLQAALPSNAEER